MTSRDLIFPEKVTAETSTLTNTYGKFYAEPFERGYGHTLGNSLRRVLLSSIEGAAITSVRVKGALHEYATLRGVKEDVLSLILNLKQVRPKLYSTGPELVHLSVEEEGVVKAKNIQVTDNVEIANPDQYIATVDIGGKLNMELEISRGRGYLPSEKQKRDNLPSGTILLDATFTPITKVHYEVEQARVGQVIDFDRLIIEIWTDGTVKPLDALAYSAKIIRDGLAIFIPAEMVSREQEVKVEETPLPAEDKVQDLLNQQVSIIELSVRASKCLKKARIRTVRELVRKKEDELLVYRNFGRKSLEEIKKKIEELGLYLGYEV